MHFIIHLATADWFCGVIGQSLGGDPPSQQCFPFSTPYHPYKGQSASGLIRLRVDCLTSWKAFAQIEAHIPPELNYSPIFTLIYSL